MTKVNDPFRKRPGLYYWSAGCALEVKWPAAFVIAGVSIKNVERWAMSSSIVRPNGKRPKM
jgi:hypothetical protein